jgi:NitT/TauT family transport system ATP-binding protein
MTSHPSRRPFAEVTDVSMYYGGTHGTLALEDVTMNINHGEIVAVVGPSGCGKSTLMRLMSGLWLATEGGVIIDGREVDRPLSIVGMAFQNPTLLPWRSILDNVMLPLEVVEEHRVRFRRHKAEYLDSKTGFPISCRVACSSAPRCAVH